MSLLLYQVVCQYELNTRLLLSIKKEELFIALVKDYYKLRCVNVVWSVAFDGLLVPPTEKTTLRHSSDFDGSRKGDTVPSTAAKGLLSLREHW